MLSRIPPAVEDDAMSAQTKYAAMSRRAAMTAAALAAMATPITPERLLMISTDHGPNGKKQPSCGGWRR